MSWEELKEKEKTFKKMVTDLSSIVILFFIFGIVSTAQKGFNSFILFSLAFLGIMVNSWYSLKSVRAEIKARKEANV